MSENLQTKIETEPTDPSLQITVKRLGIGQSDYHIFLCTGPKCCQEEEGLAVWQYLKKRLVEEGLVYEARNETSPNVYRSKAQCLRLCQKGPVAVVYPEGVWYKNITQEGIDQIIESHFKKGVPIEPLFLY